MSWIYKDLLRVKHKTMMLDQLIDKVYAAENEHMLTDGDELLVMQDDDGIFHEYDDTYDIIIHFTSAEARDDFIKTLREGFNGRQ